MPLPPEPAPLLFRLEQSGDLPSPTTDDHDFYQHWHDAILTAVSAMLQKKKEGLSSKPIPLPSIILNNEKLRSCTTSSLVLGYLFYPCEDDLHEIRVHTCRLARAFMNDDGASDATQRDELFYHLVSPGFTGPASQQWSLHTALDALCNASVPVCFVVFYDVNWASALDEMYQLGPDTILVKASRTRHLTDIFQRFLWRCVLSLARPEVKYTPASSTVEQHSDTTTSTSTLSSSTLTTESETETKSGPGLELSLRPPLFSSAVGTIAWQAQRRAITRTVSRQQTRTLGVVNTNTTTNTTSTTTDDAYWWWETVSGRRGATTSSRSASSSSTTLVDVGGARLVGRQSSSESHGSSKQQ